MEEDLRGRNLVLLVVTPFSACVNCSDLCALMSEKIP